MSEEDIFEKVKTITANKLQVKPEEVVATAAFEEDLNADSLDVVEIVMAFEEEFNIEIPDEDSGGIITVGDAANYIGQKLQA